MADTLTTMQYSLGRVERRLVDLTTHTFYSPLMALARDGKGIANIKKHGRGLTAYFNIGLYPAGSFGPVSESGTYPATTAESETQASLALRMFAMTLGVTEHALIAMENDPTEIKVGLNTKLQNSIEHTQRRMADQFAGRGDGTGGRANGAGSSSTTITFDDPPLFQVGDVIYSNPTREIATATGESGKITGATITDIDYDAMTATIAADTWDDGDVIHLSGATNNTAGGTVWVQGLQAAYDNVDDSFQWDDEDDATYDHCDTYLGLTRSSTSKANVAYVNIGGYPTLTKVQSLVRKCMARGANPKDLVSLWNPLTYDKYCESIEGYAPESVNLKLPGGTFEVPVIGHGIANLPVIDDVRIQRDKILVIDKSKLYRLTAPGGWNKRAGQFWIRNTYSSGDAGNVSQVASFQALFDIWYNLACVLPDTSCVGYGVSTS